MKNWKLITYKPKLTEVRFNIKTIPRKSTKGIIIKSESENYNEKNITHAYIHLNGTIDLGLNQDMISVYSKDYLVVKILVRHKYESDKSDSLKSITSTTDWLLASQLDALAWLCRKWFNDYGVDDIIYECGEMFPNKLLTKYIANEGFTRYV